MSLLITLGAENIIGVDSDVHPFRFANSDLCVFKDSGLSWWSTNDGGSWSTTPANGRTNPGPISGDTIEQGATYCNGALTIISLRGTCSGASPGPYTTSFRKSTNDWITVTDENGLLYASTAKDYIGDEGDTNPGYIFHHGLAFSLDGRLIGTFFGCNTGDDTPFDGYPQFPVPPPGGPLTSCNKSRTLVLYSEYPYGAVWNNATTIGYDQCFARGTQADPQPLDIAIAVPITQEGFNEADLERLSDGTYFAVSRTGSRKAIAAGPVPWTALYGARSADGVTWKLPRALMLNSATPIISASPKLIVLGNGVLAILYCAPDAYIAFSEDNGQTWSNATQLTTSDNDLGGVQVGWNTVLAFYYSVTLSNFVARQVVADVVGHETDPSVQIITTPPVVKSGQSALLQWFTNGATVTSLQLHGGVYSNTPIDANSYAGTGNLTADTTYTITGNGGAYSTAVTVRVVP